MHVLSLFDGISCGQIALNRCGIKYDKYFASEIDKNAIKVTQHNYPNTIQLGSVLNVKESDLPKIDLLTAGSPCQGFSSAGKGLNFEDPRSKLFFEFVRLLKECKPKYFLLENVRMKKECQDIISQCVGVQPIKINSSLFTCQDRKRFYWTNIPVNSASPKLLKIENYLDSDVILEINREVILKRRGHGYLPTKEYSTNVIPALFTTNSDYFVKSSITGSYRKLTPTEFERFQTLPLNYTSLLSKTQRFKCIGNGWTVDVIAHILKNVK